MISDSIKQKTLARRYAKAFLNTFWNELTPDDFAGLERAYLFFKKRTEASFLMHLSFLKRAVKFKALQTMRIELGFSSPFDKLMGLLIDQKRTALLDLVFFFLQEEAATRKEKIKFVVSFVGTLSAESKKDLVDWLEKETGKRVICEYKEDKNLIAGLRLQNDHYLWEASIRDRLNRIRCSLKR